MARKKAAEAPVDDNPRRRLYIAQVRSDSGHGQYAVTIRNGQWECACRAWCTRVPRHDCKHISRVKDAAVQSIQTGKLSYYGVDFQINWKKFAEKNLGVNRTDPGEAVLALMPLLDSADVAFAWNSIVEIVHDALVAAGENP